MLRELFLYGCIRNNHLGELSKEEYNVIEIQDVGVRLLAIFNQIVDDFKQLPECHGGLKEFVEWDDSEEIIEKLMHKCLTPMQIKERVKVTVIRMIGGLKGSIERAMRYGWSEITNENALQMEHSSRDLILAILREADQSRLLDNGLIFWLVDSFGAH